MVYAILSSDGLNASELLYCVTTASISDVPGAPGVSLLLLLLAAALSCLAAVHITHTTPHPPSWTLSWRHDSG